eukprot:GHVS01037438.1.p2 GENE.GHVS01037438.1~~GHVS01037438.1.p2  ORF type:complete len:101 (-),score=12.48 GHVS01037438.1:174-476(-)
MQLIKHHTTAIPTITKPTIISASCHGSRWLAASFTEVAASVVKSTTESRTEVHKAEALSPNESPMVSSDGASEQHTTGLLQLSRVQRTAANRDRLEIGWL